MASAEVALRFKVLPLKETRNFCLSEFLWVFTLLRGIALKFEILKGNVLGYVPIPRPQLFCAGGLLVRIGVNRLFI